MRTSQGRRATRSILLTLCLGIVVTGAEARTWRERSRPTSGTIPFTQPAPKAVVPFNSFTFGDVYRGEIIRQIFVIKNEGDADLQIKDFIAGCGCSITRSDRVIPPGKEGTAELEVQTVSQSGLISKTATLHTNDPAKPAIIFTLIANVLPGTSLRQGIHLGPLFLAPATQAAMYAAPGKKALAEFSVTADDAQVKLLRVDAGTKNFVARLEVVEPGKRYRIVVESAQIEVGGLYTDKLRVATDNPALPEFTLDLALRVYEKQ